MPKVRLTLFTVIMPQVDLRTVGIVLAVQLLLFGVFYAGVQYGKHQAREEDLPHGATILGLEMAVYNTSAMSDFPSLAIVCRTYTGAAMEAYLSFLVSFELFRPKTWPLDVIVIWDDESRLDHTWATIFAHIPPYPTTYFEKNYPEIFCSNWRRAGYSRQVYSHFHSDLYVSEETKYVGIVDSDTVFVSPITEESLFVNGKPRMMGIYGDAAMSAGTPIALGKNQIGEFMVAGAFPFIVKKEHFAEIRDYVAKHLGVANFHDAWPKICEVGGNNNKYSQFNIIATYLWYFRHDEYHWIVRQPRGHPGVGALNPPVPGIEAYDEPFAGITKHAGHGHCSEWMLLMADYICVSSSWRAGSCPKWYSPALDLSIRENLMLDLTFPNLNWTERGFPSVWSSNRVEKPHPDWRNVSDHLALLWATKYADGFEWKPFRSNITA